MSFLRYPKYKDSGVEWLDSIPSHWEVVRAAHLFKEVAEQGSEDLPILSVSIHHGVSDNELNDEELDRKVARSDDRMKYKRVQPGDLVYNMMRAWQGGFGTVRVTGMVSPAYVVARPKSQFSTVFVEHLLRTPNAIEEMRRHSHGVTDFRLRLYWDYFKDLYLALPPQDEQLAIIRFLEREVAKIDGLVLAQQQLIELLKEKRQVIICQAVTRGLDPNAPMKNSGVEWLGEVPEHWAVVPLRTTAKLESGHTPSRSRPDWWIDCHIPWFTLADVWQIREEGREVVYETKELVSDIGLENSSARLLPAGTVMLSRTASVGFSAIMGVDMATTQDFANWICGPRLSNRYLLKVFRAMTGEFRRLMMGSTHNTIYMPDIAAFRVPLPPKSEQDAIVASIDDTISKLDDLTAEANAVIDLLQERRVALISAAVTGAIDVRNTVETDVSVSDVAAA